MEQTLEINPITEQNSLIQETVLKERQRLLGFIKKRIPKNSDAEDILQDVYFELIETYRLMRPVEQLASWLFTVARNKITDLYRKKGTESLDEIASKITDDDEKLFLADLIPNNLPNAEMILWQESVMETITKSLDEIPEEQKQVFIMHEFEDMSFKEMEDILHVPIKTLISRKRYAVLYLRTQLQTLYNELFN
jgi:RNA polymerase sigma factor (sigma-70 family)